MYSHFYEIPLPALCFEKTEEIAKPIKSENDTEERNDAFQNQQQKKNDVRKITMLTESTAKGPRIKRKKDDNSRTNNASKTENDMQKRTSISGKQNNDVKNNAHRNSQTSARIWKNHRSLE